MTVDKDRHGAQGTVARRGTKRTPLDIVRAEIERLGSRAAVAAFDREQGFKRTHDALELEAAEWYREVEAVYADIAQYLAARRHG